MLWISVIFKVKGAVMKSYLLVELAINPTMVDASYHITELDVTKLLHKFSKAKSYMDVDNKNELHTH